MNNKKMIYNKKNKFYSTAKSVNLSKINPYYENKDHYLPYRYTDPSFKTKYKGPLMQKDLYILNLMNNHLCKNFNKTVKNFFTKSQPKSQFSSMLTSNVANLTELVFNSEELRKKQIMDDYSKYISSILKSNFFSFNPIASKDQLIKYREYLYNNVPTYKGKPRKIHTYYLNEFNEEMRNRNYKNWKKIKEEYKKKGFVEDKYYNQNGMKDVKKNINRNEIERNKNKNNLSESSSSNESEIEDALMEMYGTGQQNMRVRVVRNNFLHNKGFPSIKNKSVKKK